MKGAKTMKAVKAMKAKRSAKEHLAHRAALARARYHTKKAMKVTKLAPKGYWARGEYEKVKKRGGASRYLIKQ